MLRSPFKPNPVVVLVLITLAILSSLAAGVLQRQINFTTRGVFSVHEPINEQDNGFALGLVVDLSQYDQNELDENLSEIASIGVQTVRQTYYFSTDFDWAVADAHFAAIQKQPSLTMVPLLDGNPADAFAPINPESFAQWAAEFASRYGDQVEHYIIWDEPNITTHWGMGEINPQSYAAILSAASSTIRAADPDAKIVLAPLAPTTENNQINMAEAPFLQAVYSTGVAEAFDVVATKPYGFDSHPADRTVDQNALNFSRPILVREVMLAQGDGYKPIWGGNWGWNGLPAGWAGPKSPWESVSQADQVIFTKHGAIRATAEWPWMSKMFLHHWDPVTTGPNDPASGFTVKGSSLTGQLSDLMSDQSSATNVAGYYPATADMPHTEWRGDWRFSPEFGADMSEKSDGQDPDQVIFRFQGTEVGLKVRRANYRARLNIMIDGVPANALPTDERTAEYGSALVLNTNSPDEDRVETILVAENLPPGEHEMVITGFRGWDQWALKGFIVANQPDLTRLQTIRNLLWAAAAILGVLGLAFFKSAGVGRWTVSFLPTSLTEKGFLLLTSLAGLLVSLTGWLTWGATAEGAFRRLGDGSQLLMLFGTAIVFYVTPWLPVYLLALLLLFLVIYQRPMLGLVLIAFSIPFYVPQLQKPVAAYRFSPVEIFTVVSFGAILLKTIPSWFSRWSKGDFKWESGLSTADWGVLLLLAASLISLPFTERLGVATNELRTVIIGPILFYWMMRNNKPTDQEIRWLLLAFIGGGLLVALIGLGQYFIGNNLITAEGGLQRLRSIYGSPNNVALYLGRIYPILLAGLVGTFWQDGLTLQTVKRFWPFLLTLAVITLAMLLSFSRGGILLGLPIATAIILFLHQQRRQRPVWPWLAAGVVGVSIIYFAALQVPALAGRLNLSSQTAGFRINLWVSSLQMIQDRPLVGHGLDNFLYAYRGKYILARAWQEPNLNHPHNHILDFTTRLGLIGLLSGILIFWGTVKNLIQKLSESPNWPLITGLIGAIGYILGHGLVDHSFFLIDLAYSTLLISALSHIDFRNISLFHMQKNNKSG